MNVTTAARNTLKLLANKDHAVLSPPGQAATIDHLRMMVGKIKSGEVTGEKAHRWLGWIQGVIYTRFTVTLEDMKRVNKEAA